MPLDREDDDAFGANVALNGDDLLVTTKKKTSLSEEDSTCDGLFYAFSAAELNVAETSLLDVVVYPNPSDGQLTLELPTNEDAFQVNLYDVLGKQVTQTTGIGDKLFMNFELPKGLYVLEVSRNSKAIYRTKLVVE